jgi:hypothetical protein
MDSAENGLPRLSSSLVWVESGPAVRSASLLERKGFEPTVRF